MISNTAEACPCRHLFIESPQDRAANPHDITKGRKTGIRKKKKNQIHDQHAPYFRTLHKPATEKLDSDLIILFGARLNYVIGDYERRPGNVGWSKTTLPTNVQEAVDLLHSPGPGGSPAQ